MQTTATESEDKLAPWKCELVLQSSLCLYPLNEWALARMSVTISGIGHRPAWWFCSQGQGPGFLHPWVHQGPGRLCQYQVVKWPSPAPQADHPFHQGPPIFAIMYDTRSGNCPGPG